MNALFNHKAISCDTDGENVQKRDLKINANINNISNIYKFQILLTIIVRNSNIQYKTNIQLDIQIK